MSESVWATPAWRAIWYRDRDFWGRVHGCSHGQYCDRCCWPYVLERESRRVLVRRHMSQLKYGQSTVHKVAWELYHDAVVPEGRQARHTCRNLDCANPHHVRIV
jgi:hypothetical protein